MSKNNVHSCEESGCKGEMTNGTYLICNECKKMVYGMFDWGKWHFGVNDDIKYSGKKERKIHLQYYNRDKRSIGESDW